VPFFYEPNALARIKLLPRPLEEQKSPKKNQTGAAASPSGTTCAPLAAHAAHTPQAVTTSGDEGVVYIEHLYSKVASNFAPPD
jgi:hypothetical protein